MTVNLEKECEIPFSFDVEKVAMKVLEAVMDAEGCPYEAQADITLTTDEEIHEINLQQRNIDRATDVLSFPMTQFPEPGKFDFLEHEVSSFHPDTGELMLGDIVISVDHVIAQAEEFGHSTLREYAFLIAHSLLHLIGYDHMMADEAKIMEDKQDSILNGIGITRSI